VRPSVRDLIVRLHPLLDHVLRLEPAEREAWLGRLRGDDPDLAGRLEKILASEQESDSLFEDRAWADVTEAPPPLAGLEVGAYRLERPLGQGGMGTVWLARRSDGRFEGRAAVKLLNLALLDSVGRERFQREGTLLARLTHPNIARLIDAGVTRTGQPYLVLEYVEGRRLDHYCDQEHLPPHRRLELFLQVLGAVAHAHANLIVHRDIKPSNILATADGTVKLLDFGIAKLLESETSAGQRPALTELGGLALTPEYAAPEQVSGGPVTTATDVYALGVLLYILLAGRHPTGESCRTTAEHLRAVSEVEPARLSTAVADRRRRLYAGDLDNILAKALKKDPVERYPTVQALAEDVRRHLRHEPVTARPDSVGYRLGKFVRRNRAAVALGAVALVALLAGVAGTATQARRASGQAVQAERQRERADREARAAEEERDVALRALSRVEAINELNHYLLRDAAPFGKPFTFGYLLSQATDLVGRERAESDANRTDMLIEIGQDYYTQDDDKKSREVLEQAYTLSRPLTDHSTRARAACALGVEMSHWDGTRAEQLVEEGLTELPPGAQYDVDRITCLQYGAEVAENTGGPEGVQRAERALALYRQLRFPVPSWEPQLVETLASAYDAAGRFRDAVRLDEEVSQRLVALGRDNTQSAGTLYNNWALTLSRMGQPHKAAPLFRKALQMESVDPAGRVVSSGLMTNLARTLSELGQLGEAARLAERAYANARQAGDEELGNQAMLVRAGIYIKQGRLGEAKAMLDQVEPRLVRALPRGHYAFASITMLRALLTQAHGDLHGALMGANSAASILEANIAAGQQTGGYLPTVLRRRAEIEQALGRYTEAERDARRAIELLHSQVEPGEPNAGVGLAYLSLAQALNAEGRNDDAQRAFASASEQLEPTLGVDHPATRQARAHRLPPHPK
jgi:serine/threonine protein kinase/tetratricopeptide (TPR) repeat protein